MSANGWTPEKTARARELWQEYQQRHDVSALRGQVVGIDPDGGRLWFGESARAICEQLGAEQVDAPLLFVRVGFKRYLRKGGRPPAGFHFSSGRRGRDALP